MFSVVLAVASTARVSLHHGRVSVHSGPGQRDTREAKNTFFYTITGPENYFEEIKKVGNHFGLMVEKSR